MEQNTISMLMYHTLAHMKCQAEAKGQAQELRTKTPEPTSTKPDPDAKPPILRKTQHKEK